MQPRIDLMTNEAGARIGKRFFNVNLAIEQTSVPKTTLELLALRASQINGCGWCIDIHTKEAAALGETALRLNLVAGWRHSTVFTESERAQFADLLDRFVAAWPRTELSDQNDSSAQNDNSAG